MTTYCIRVPYWAHFKNFTISSECHICGEILTLTAGAWSLKIFWSSEVDQMPSNIWLSEGTWYHNISDFTKENPIVEYQNTSDQLLMSIDQLYYIKFKFCDGMCDLFWKNNLGEIQYKRQFWSKFLKSVTVILLLSLPLELDSYLVSTSTIYMHYLYVCMSSRSR